MGGQNLICSYMRFEAFMAVKIQVKVFWVVTTLHGITTQKTSRPQL